MHPKAFLYDLKCTQTENGALPSEGNLQFRHPIPTA